MVGKTKLKGYILMKFSLIHPSRGRPQQAYGTVTEWISKSGNVEVEHILSIDTSDPLKVEYDNLFPSYLCNDNKSVVEATNNAAKQATGDVLIYLSDDFKCPDNWGELIEAKGLTGEWVLKVDDCLQPFNVAVLTIPIMSRSVYNKLGYFWHPEYKSMFCDEHLYWKAKLNNWLVMAPELKFPHHHYSVGKAQHDETYKNSEANWDQGKAVFAKHKAEGFK